MSFSDGGILARGKVALKTHNLIGWILGLEFLVNAGFLPSTRNAHTSRVWHFLFTNKKAANCRDCRLYRIVNGWGTLRLYEKPDQDWLREKNSLYLHPNFLQTLRPKNKQKIRSVQMCKDKSTPTWAAKYFTVVFLIPCWPWLKCDFAVLILTLEKSYIIHDESWECHVNRGNKHTAVVLSRFG